jgi:hypothetical protein
MSCNSCKKKSSYEDIISKIDEPLTSSQKIKLYTVKFFIFLLLSIILTPLIIPILVVILFKVIVLSEGVDISPLLLYIGRKIFPKEEELEEPIDEEFNEDDYELVNKYDIVKID